MATTNGSFAQQEQYKSSEQYTPTAGHAASESANTATNGNSNQEPSKDEVGWYFVEQYYTTLSRSPEKLHLFYGKRSQFVAGLEAESSPVSVGRASIQDRIKTLDFHECKVRISNVDSQASDSNIVIQVIGEISNKSADLKKFVQTFVLAKQPTGYFVLNDVFRYIKEDLEEEVETGGQEEQLSEAVEMPKAQEPAEEHKDGVLDAAVVNKKLEETIEAAPAAVTPTNGNSSTPVVEEAEEAPVAAVKTEEVADETASTEDIEKAVEEETIKQPELPKDPVPTPALTRQTTSTAKKPAVPAQPAGPPKPMSWANRAAAAAAASAPKPAVPAPVTKTASPAPPAARAAPAPQAATPAAAAPASSNKENEAPQQSGWQSVGSDHAKRQNRPQSVSAAAPLEKEGTMGYVRNVTEGVKTEELRAALSSYGELVYFDINRQKNCAFVEFASTAGYQAAADANPHLLGGEEIIVEPRRPKSSAYGGSGYNSARGGVNNRGRGGFDQGRGGQRGGRGDFGGANRGRGAPRGRGGAPATTA